MNVDQRRTQQIERLALRLGYSYESAKYGVKLLRMALSVLSNDTLSMMEDYLGVSGDRGRSIVTALMADQSEEVLREVIVFGDVMKIDDVAGMVRIMNGLRERYEFSGVSDLSRLDESRQRGIRACCMVQGALYRANPNLSGPKASYPVDPDIFRVVFRSPERAIPITRLVDLGDIAGVARITGQKRQIHRIST